MSLAELQERRLRVRGFLSRRDGDPLAFWHFAVERLKAAFRLFVHENPIEELALQACNLGTKTETVAAYVLACAQKRKELDGIPLPQWRGPVECAQFVLDYKAQLLSVQPAYLRLLGNWPYHARWNGEYLSSLKIMPVGGDPHDESGWSVLHFISMENKRAGVGFRLDVAAFDEPPPMEVLREVRKAAHAGRWGIRIIGFTPTVRRQWWPIREDFGDTPRRSLTRLDKQRAVVRWSLDEVASWVISDERKAALKANYARDPLRDAREHGDYITTEGGSPWGELGTIALVEMLELCREPEIVFCRVQQEATEGMAQIAKLPVQVWEKPRKGTSYYVVSDPASGVDDNHHDPLAIHVVEMGNGNLCARFVDYLSPYSLGRLQAGLARQYNNALVDVEVNDRWGVNVYRGIGDSHYGNLGKEPRELKPGVWSNEIGFHNNQNTRPIIIGSVQEWADSWSAGHRYGLCPSREVIECLLDCILDEDGKIVGAPGVHDEDLILRGQSLRKAVTNSGRLIPEVYRPPLTRIERTAREIAGVVDEDDYEAPFGQAVMGFPAAPGV